MEHEAFGVGLRAAAAVTGEIDDMHPVAGGQERRPVPPDPAVGAPAVQQAEIRPAAAGFHI